MKPTPRQDLAATPAAQPITAIREFLTFALGQEEYAVDILRVQELRSYEAPTRMANTPAFIKGVVNLRGVIVLNIGRQVVGMVVDGVSDVISLTAAEFRPVPKFSSAIGSDYLLAIGTVQERMLILLDIEKFMTGAEMGLVAQALQ